MENVMQRERMSSHMEDYLEAIALLIEEHGHAHARDVARRLDVKMPSVTSALKLLAARGCLDYEPNMPVLLTPQGRRLAENVLKKHRILRRFFQHILLLPSGAANRLACRIEHEVDERAVLAVRTLTRAIESRADCAELRRHLRETLAGKQAVPDESIVNSEPGV